MKKIIVCIALLFVAGTISLFATNEPNNITTAKEVFQNEFAGAEQVKWSSEGEFLKAWFVLGGNSAIALFTQEGELLGSIRNIFYNQLPLAIITVFEKKFTNAVILDVNEVNNSGGTKYKISFERNGKKYKTTFYPDGNGGPLEKIK